MKLSAKYRVHIINMLISLAISLIVNFSYFVFMLMSTPSSGPLRRSAMSLSPYPTLFISLQVLYFVVLSFILITIVTSAYKGNKSNKISSNYGRRLIYCTLVTIGFYFFTPISNKSGGIMILAFAFHLFNPMLLLKSSFTLIVIMLYGKIFELVYQKQHIVIENQTLKNENLQTRYNMLINQINPHFFFNSLNSLAMLVREKHNDKALSYIDRLSDTFRYIIQNGQNGTTTLKEELKFLDAYKYLHEVRYANKLFFDINIDNTLSSWLLPTLSLQPLIENAVKHNSITTAKPFTITITTQNNHLIVSNPLIAKIDEQPGTGIGLKNLSSRYLLLMGQDIKVERTADKFSIQLPLTAPKSCE